ncbi:hypothetical protein E2C01_008704 [Portunus trituberculatus]|uniref:Uncharacterized protein n=1 Tax=Portunus trituberculatus TaxID=210409 RepID=A0A5B7D3R7_PORTR|nr:hypothetical protein [Portunus trituberculatus]
MEGETRFLDNGSALIIVIHEDILSKVPELSMPSFALSERASPTHMPKWGLLELANLDDIWEDFRAFDSYTPASPAEECHGVVATTSTLALSPITSSMPLTSW